MLTTYPASKFQDGPVPSSAAWIDLFNPTAEERTKVESEYGLELPSRAELSEVELSSRVSEKGGVLFLNMPAVSRAASPNETPSPLGFVLSKAVLVTVRYAPLRSFESVAETMANDNGHRSGVETFSAIVDAMVDLSADLLEETARDLDAISSAVFSNRLDPSRHVTRSNEELRGILIRVGTAGEHLSRIRDTVLGLQRIVTYVSGRERDWIPRAIVMHLGTPQNDLLSLTEYETHLSDKVQFLLDAVLGFINTKQNDIFQVLTVISVVGIPPTLVASIYGMNFRNMPELNWAWGYEYGLALIVLSAVVPILWFKWRRWV
jgi:magnesium transporter